MASIIADLIEGPKRRQAWILDVFAADMDDLCLRHISYRQAHIAHPALIFDLLTV
jgi:hypothetical protein